MVGPGGADAGADERGAGDGEQKQGGSESLHGVSREKSSSAQRPASSSCGGAEAERAEARDLGALEAPCPKRVAPERAALGRRPARGSRRAAEARRRRRLHDPPTSRNAARPAAAPERGAPLERQHRREAHVGALHDRAPLVAGLGLEDRARGARASPPNGCDRTGGEGPRSRGRCA